MDFGKPIAKIKKYYGASDACPFCGSKETVAHVFLCPSAKCFFHCTGALQDVQAWLIKGKTPPGIMNAILSGMQQWFSIKEQNSSDIKAPTIGKLGTLEVLLAKAFTDQTRDIGWLPFLQGKCSKYWTAAYKQTLPKAVSTTSNADQWGKQLVLTLWMFSRSVWEHRNMEIHGQTLHEVKSKTTAKLGKEILHFHQKYNDASHLVRQHHHCLFNTKP
jgi:hypothetical protein